MTSRYAKAVSLFFVLLLLHLSHPVRSAWGGDSAGTEASLPPALGGAGAVAVQHARGSAAAGLRPVLAGSAFLLGSVGVVLELESDREYARYLNTADPRRMSSHYDAAERKRAISTAALIGAELSAVALVVTYLVQERPAEPQPGSVIIGLAVAPGGVAVRVRW